MSENQIVNLLCAIESQSWLSALSLIVLILEQGRRKITQSFWNDLFKNSFVYESGYYLSHKTL